jgi:hypothetical protein
MLREKGEMGRMVEAFKKTMLTESFPTFILTAFVALAGTFSAIRLFQIALARKKIALHTAKVMEIYFHKVDKIPVIVESIRKYAPESEIYAELINLHRKAIVTNAFSVYDILETDARISAKFRFLMRISVKIPEISRDGNFLYARSLWIFYESAGKDELFFLNEAIRDYEHLRKTRARTFFAALFPIREILPIRP